MRREAVAQRMGRGAVRAGPAGSAPPGPSGGRWRARAAHPWRRGTMRASAGDRPGAGREIGLDRLAHLRQQRHDPGLVALAGDAERRAERQHRAGQAGRFADAEASAVEQHQHRPVARADPGLGRILLDILGQRDRLVGRDGARHALLDARALHPGWGPCPAGEDQEGAHRRQFPRCRRVAQPFAAPKR